MFKNHFDLTTCSQFYSECSEAESYLKEIAHLITTDTPADEASAETMLTKHKSVQVLPCSLNTRVFRYYHAH